MLLGQIFIIAICFYLLNKVCDEYFISSLDKISKRLKISSDVAGTTFMAVASSAPELSVSLIAVFKPGAHDSLGMGTIVGSALFNLLFVVGASIIVAGKIKFLWQTVLRDSIFYFTIILLLLVAFWDGKIVLFEALTFVILYAIYVFLAIYWRRILPAENFFYHVEGEIVLGWREILASVKEIEEEVERPWHHPQGMFSILKAIIDKFFSVIFINKERYLWVFFVAIGFIVFFSWQIVDAAIVIAQTLHVPEVVIALTVLGVGASIPDFLTSFLVAREGRGTMAINNAIGSNIFDILFGLGLPWLLVILLQQQEVSLNRDGLITSVVFLFSAVALFLTMSFVRNWRLGKISGAFFIVCYLGYLVFEVLKSL